MEFEDLFLKIKFKCEKCGREFETTAITAEPLNDTCRCGIMIFAHECLTCGSLCTAKVSSLELERKFLTVLDGIKVPFVNGLGMRYDPKRVFKWRDFCIKGSEIYDEVKKYPEFADLGAYYKLDFWG